MTVIVDTDMRGFEGALDEEFCHLFDTGDSHSACGLPASLVADSDHYGYVVGGRCDHCGRLLCPDCAFAEPEAVP